MDQPLRAHTLNEARYYLMVTPCQACGKGPWVFDSAQVAEVRKVAVLAHCKNCALSRSFEFLVEHDVPQAPPEGEIINPTGQPSRIIDLAQWLSLFYLLVESAAAEPTPQESRRSSFRAALCLDEALKFYGDNELPPPSAFFTPTSADVFRQHPENFARQRLRDMKGRLPAVATMARRIARDERVRKKRWWQFWRF